MGLGREGMGAMCEHGLSTVVGVGRSLDAKALEHGVRLPPTKEADGVRVNASTEEGSGATGTKGARGEESEGDPGGGFQGFGGPAEGIGDEFCLDVVPLASRRMRVAEAVERMFGRCGVRAKSWDDAAESFDAADEGIVGGTMACLLATDCILLVSEFETGVVESA